MVDARQGAGIAAFLEANDGALVRATVDHRVHFAVLVAGDTCPVKKPDLLPLLESCRRLGVAAAAALVVGDSTTDIAAAQAAGIPVVCVSYGYNGGVDLAAHNPDAVIDEFAAILPLLRCGGGRRANGRPSPMR